MCKRFFLSQNFFLRIEINKSKNKVSSYSFVLCNDGSYFLLSVYVNVVAIRALPEAVSTRSKQQGHNSGRKKNKRMKYVEERRTSENIEPTRKLCVDSLSSLAIIVLLKRHGGIVRAYLHTLSKQ